MIKNLITNPKFSEDIAVKRQAPGSRNNKGDYVVGATTSTSMKAVTSPLTADNMHLVRDSNGARFQDYRVFYITDDEIRSLRVGTEQTPGDSIEYNGFDWQVDSVQYWPKFGFSEVVGIRLPGQDG